MLQIKFIEDGKEEFVLRSGWEAFLLLCLAVHGALLINDIRHMWLPIIERDVGPADIAAGILMTSIHGVAYAWLRRRNSRRAAAGEEAVLRAVSETETAQRPTS